MPKSSKIYFRRDLAQGYVRVEQTETKDGRWRANSSLNAEKVADTTRHFLQNNPEYSDFKYDKLVIQAQDELEEAFDRLGFNSPSSVQEAKRFKTLKRIAISNWLEDYIARNFPRKLRIDFDTFIEATGIARANNNIKKAIMLLEEVQNQNFYEVERYEVDLETGERRTGLSRVAALPSITLWLDESVAGKGMTMLEFANSDIKNKRELIKGIEIEFNSTYFYHVLSIGDDYVVGCKEKRHLFSHVASFKLDILLSSLHNIQNNREAVTFTVAELKDQLGVSQKTPYKYFKRDTLLKAISDIEGAYGKTITMIEDRDGGRSVATLTFKIVLQKEDERNVFFYDYVASQIYYFHEPSNIEDIGKFASYLKGLKESDWGHRGDKSYEEWIEEANKAYRCEQEVMQLLSKDANFFQSKGIIYEPKMHTVRSAKINLIDGESVVSHHFIKDSDGSRITNPIESQRYLLKLEMEHKNKSVHVIDVMPFVYAYFAGKWKKIYSIDDFIPLREQIYKDILLKNVDKFTFADVERENLFKYYVEREMFAEVLPGLRDKIEKVFNIADLSELLEQK